MKVYMIYVGFVLWRWFSALGTGNYLCKMSNLCYASGHTCSHSGKSLLKVLQEGMASLVLLLPFSFFFSFVLYLFIYLLFLFFVFLFCIPVIFFANYSVIYIICHVVGVLEANFIEPAHDKQDFERSPLSIRLETRLKQTVLDYW